MPRSYTKVRDIVEDFMDSMELVTEVDISPWQSIRQANDSIRRCIQKKRFDEIYVFRHGGKLFLAKR